MTSIHDQINVNVHLEVLSMAIHMISHLPHHLDAISVALTSLDEGGWVYQGDDIIIWDTRGHIKKKHSFAPMLRS
jgi:hypothetical protein